MSGRPESAVRPRVGGWGAVGALVGLGAAIGFGGGAATLLIALLIGAALPMWWLEYRSVQEQREVAAASPALSGAAAVSSMFIASVLIQLAIGGMKGAAVGVLLLPALVVSALAVLLALVKPALIGSTVVLAGSALRGMLRRVVVSEEEKVALLGWGVKAVFLPLMLGWALVWLDGLDHQLAGDDYFFWFSAPFVGMYAIDTAFGAIGYMSTSRRFDAHIRSVDTTWLGWISALACYPPLSVLVLDIVLVYRYSSDWTAWLSAGSTAAYLWGGVILGLTAVYTWATVVFGPRFSNLTHRGIITSGPYRWSKHPAYLGKNLSWWFISVPFLPVLGWTEAVWHCAALLGVNFIYYVRARTEERHLMRDPLYAQYADWMSENGLFARMRAAVGCLRGAAT